MPSYGVLIVAEGVPIWLETGDLIGRSPSATLWINHDSVSEFHAIVACRSGLIHLTPLRGSLDYQGWSKRRVPLKPGMQIGLSHQKQIQVLDVKHPDRVLALESDEGVQTPLLRGRCWVDGATIDEGPTAPRVGVCIFQSDGLFYQQGEGQAPVELMPGDRIGQFSVIEWQASPTTKPLVAFREHPNQVSITVGEKTMFEFQDSRGDLFCTLWRLSRGNSWVSREDLQVAYDGVSLQEQAIDGTLEIRRATLSRVLHQIRHRLRSMGMSDSIIQDRGARGSREYRIDLSSLAQT